MTLAERLVALQDAFTGKALAVDKSAELNALVADLTAKVSEKEAALTAATAKIAELEAAVAKAASEQDAAIKALDEISKAQESAGKKAAKIAAEVGVVPVETLPAASAEKSDQEIIDEYAAIKDPAEKSAFYAAKARAAFMRVAKIS